MGGKKTGHSVRQLGEHDTDYLPAIHIALDAQPNEKGDVAPAVAELLAAAGRQECRLDLVFAAYRNRRLEGAVLAYESGEASALVYIPRLQRTNSKRAATVACLRALRTACNDRSIKILESLVETDALDASIVVWFGSAP